MKLYNFFVLIIICLTLSQAQQNTNLEIKISGDSVISTISDHFFGMNYWMWCNSWGNKIEGTAQKISELNVNLLRFGGIAVDVGYPDPVTNGIISDFHSYCKKIGAEPMFQLQIAKFSKIDDKVNTALSMLKYYKKIYNLSFVSVGNEPDIYAGNLAANSDYRAEYLSEYKLQNYCNDFNKVSSEVKKVYPDLKIIGLELSYNYDVWIPGFLSSCKDNLDILSVHYYPFSPGQCNFSLVSNQYEGIYDFYTHIRSLIDQNANGKNIPLIIGETNITYDGDPSKSNHDASPGTFAAALWFADYIGVSSAQKNLISIMPWSIREDWTLGFLTSQKRPIFYVYKMFSDNIGKQCIHSENINNKIRIYSYKDSLNNVSIFAVNWDTTNSYSAHFTFAGILNDSEYKCKIPPYSLSCITLSSDMKKNSFQTYTKRLESTGPISPDNRKFDSQFSAKPAPRIRFKPLN